jgi:hypothetical protein
MLAYSLYRKWPLDLTETRRAFRCATCLLGGHILIVPCKAPPVVERTWEQEVERFFHASRRASKGRSRNEEIEERVNQVLAGAAAGVIHYIERPRPLDRARQG